MLQIGATLLESFRLCRADVIKEAELIAQIKGDQLQTRKMRLGNAYHYLLGHPQLSLIGFYEHNGFVFDRPCIDRVLERLEPGGVFEMRSTRVIGKTREDEEVLLVAKPDYMRGLRVAEFKAPLDGYFALEKYTDSIQWRIEALLTGAARVDYHVACLREEVEEDASFFTLHSIDTAPMRPYPDMEHDIKDLVREFVHYVRNRRLEEYLRPKHAAKAVFA